MYGSSTKGQFFVISIVFIAIALTAIMVFLRIPEEIGPDDFYLEENIITSIDVVQKSINNLLKSSYADWWNPYYRERMKIILNETKNSESNFINYIIKVDLPDDIDESSMRLVQNGHAIPHDVYWTAKGTRVGEISFQTGITKGEKKTLYLYYNRESSTSILDKLPSVNQNIKVEVFNNNVTVNSPNYQAVIDKTRGGTITSLISKNVFTNLLYNESNYRAQSLFTCNGTYYSQESDTSPTVSIIKNGTNLAIIRVTGGHGIQPGRQFFTQDQFYYPDKIKIRDSIRWTENIDCSAGAENFLMSRFSVNSSIITTYIDNDSLAVTGNYDAFDRPGPWLDYYYNKAGVGIIVTNESKFTLIKRSSSASNKTSEFILLNASILPAGTYEYTYEIYLHRNTWTETENYYNLTGIDYTESAETFDKFFTNKKEAIKRGLSNRGYTTSIVTSNEKTYQTFREQREWYNSTILPNHRKIFNAFSAINRFDHPIKFTALLQADIDLSSLFVSDDSSKILPTQIIYNNQSSSFDVYCQNPNNPLFSNYTYYLLNPDGQDFDATVSPESASPFNATLYFPNGTCAICNSTFSTESTYSLSNPPKGFYKLEITNKTDNKHFRISTTLPYSVFYGDRLRCKASGSEQIHFIVPENTTTINITVSASGSNANARIKNSDGDILKQNNSISIGTSYEFLVNVKNLKDGKRYYLEYETSGDLEILLGQGIHKSLATNESYMIDYDAPELSLIFQDDVSNSERYYVYYNRGEYNETASFTTDINVSKSDLQVNNTFFHWDFDDYVFTYKNGNNWFSSTGKWLTDFGNSSSIAGTSSTTLTNIEIIESGPVRARVRAESGTTPNVIYYFNIWARQNFITVEVEVDGSSEYDLTVGPFWRVNATSDTDFYAIYDNLNEDKYSNLFKIDRSSFAGKTVNWFGKRDSSNIVAFLVPSNQLFPSNESAKLTIDRISVALPTSQKTEFYIYIDDYENLTRWDGVRTLADYLQSPTTITDDITTAEIEAKSKFVTIKGKLI